MTAKQLKLILFGFLFISTSMISAQSNFTVGGKINLYGVDKTGDLYIFLVNEEIFKTPLKGYKKLVLKIDQDMLRTKRVPFKFSGVKQGRYGIRCFLDQNGNGKLDKGTFGPSEPWGMSFQKKRLFRWPKFKDIVFEVNSAVKNMKIEVR